MKPLATLGIAIIFTFVFSNLFGQSEPNSTPYQSSGHKPKAKAQTGHIGHAHKDEHLQKWHKGLHKAKDTKLRSEQLILGNTYDRHGALVTPKGYGVQVIAFRNIRNLDKYLHMYEKKELFIQVVSLSSFPNEKLYRVILGANESMDSVENEISLFQNAGVHAVLRKHMDTSLPVEASAATMVK